MPEELIAQEGYAAWAAGYDAHENPLIAVEEPVVRDLARAVAPARALDAACGTGRHAAFLASLGHDVVGVDASSEMLAVARQKVPGADLREGRLESLPLADESFELAVCALALSHAPSLEEPVAELARVLRRGGRLLISDLHPMLSVLGGNALFTRPDGTPAFIRDAERLHSEYLRAFGSAGLTVRGCVEPRWTPETTRMIGKAARRIPEALDAALVGLPCVVVWELERR